MDEVFVQMPTLISQATQHELSYKLHVAVVSLSYLGALDVVMLLDVCAANRAQGTFPKPLLQAFTMHDVVAWCL